MSEQSPASRRDELAEKALDNAHVRSGLIVSALKVSSVILASALAVLALTVVAMIFANAFSCHRPCPCIPLVSLMGGLILAITVLLGLIIYSLAAIGRK